MARRVADRSSTSLVSLYGGECEKMLQDQVITLAEYWKRMVRAFSRHGLEQHVVWKPPKRYNNGDLVAYVTLTGTRPNGDGSRGGHTPTVRNAEIAFYNEYGTNIVPKRLWVRTANSEAEPELEKIAQKHNEALLRIN